MPVNKQDVHESVTAYLSSLVWDRTPRLDRWLVDYAGADDTPYVRRVGRWALIAAVRRARHPGCRLDQMLVLEGPQGCGKSSALRILAVRDAWFTDEFPLNTRDLVGATAGKWIVVMSELRGLRPSDARALKENLSRPLDTSRKADAQGTSLVTQTPRSFVVVGAVNEPACLHESTSHRRFCPVIIRHFDLDKLRTNRDQLWAEAATAEALGEAVYLDLLPPKETREPGLTGPSNLDDPLANT